MARCIPGYWFDNSRRKIFEIYGIKVAGLLIHPESVRKAPSVHRRMGGNESRVSHLAFHFHFFLFWAMLFWNEVISGKNTDSRVCVCVFPELNIPVNSRNPWTWIFLSSVQHPSVFCKVAEVSREGKGEDEGYRHTPLAERRASSNTRACDFNSQCRSGHLDCRTEAFFCLVLCYSQITSLFHSLSLPFAYNTIMAAVLCV